VTGPQVGSIDAIFGLSMQLKKIGSDSDLPKSPMTVVWTFATWALIAGALHSISCEFIIVALT